jgi:phospholipase C
MDLQKYALVMLKSLAVIAMLVAAGFTTMSRAGNPPPTVQSISPNSGPTDGGTTVTITGTNFVSGATVSFGTNAGANVVVVSSTTITATSPTNSAGAVNITVTNPDGQAGTLWALQQPLNNPGFESGTTGWVAGQFGTATVITNSPGGAHSGNNYAQLSVSPPDSQVSFYSVLNGTSQYLPVNPGDVIGFGGWAFRVDSNSTGDGKARWTIEVTDSNQKNPVYVAAAPGNVTTFSWIQQHSNYTIPLGKAFVRFICQITGNTMPAEANFDDASFQRTVPGGGFTYMAPPAPTSVSPNAGSTNGGTSVSIGGTGFQSGATVAFGAAQATNVNVVNSTTITAVTPASSAGSVNVTVTNPDNQQGSLTAGYTYNPPPTVTSISPGSGPTTGGTAANIVGTNFLPGATVSFGGTPGTNVTVMNSTHIAVTTPGHPAAVVNVIVTNPDNQAGILVNGFTFMGQPPAINSISPGTGPGGGGAGVTIRGSNFLAGATVTIGGSPLNNLKVLNSGTIQGTTPAHAAGGADVVVTNPDNQFAVYTAMLHNQSFEAGNANWVFAGTGTATIVNNVNNAHNGTYYASLSAAKGNHPRLLVADGNGKAVYFAVNPGDVITFGGWAYRASGDGSARWVIEVTDANKSNPTYVSAPPANVRDAEWELQQGSYTVPSGKAFIRLYCELASSTIAAAANFDDAILQRSPGGTYGYTFVSPPVVTAIAPGWGSPAGGTSRTVFGTGFQFGASVTVGGAASSNVVVNSANAITFFVPPNAAGTVDVKVTNHDGQSGLLASSYTYQTPPPPPAGMTNIHHIIYTFQENRSFDNYFGVMNQYRAMNGVNDNAVDDLPLNVALPDIAGQMILPFHFQTECHENTQPSWNASHEDYDNGQMDLFMKTGNFFGKPSTIDPNGTRTVGYYDWTDLPYYYALGFNFAISDRWFSPMLGPTGANRAYTFAGTSLGFVSTPQAPSGGFPNMTIFDLLDQAGISWRYYYQNVSPTWLPEWSVYFKDTNNVVPISNYYTDVNNESTFPQVVFIEENGDLDEHPKPSPGVNGTGQNIQNGAKLMGNIIGSLMASPSWQSSVFVLAYDEGGGLRDHTPPPNMPLPDGYAPIKGPGDQPGLFNQGGLRVPIVVVSPWTGPQQVSHIVRDHTSILKLIEARFSLPPLTARDAAADNMAEFFNFSSPPWMTPPTLPAQPVTGTCDLNLEKAPGQ